MAFEDELKRTRIVPVMVIRDAAHAVPLARALVDGGLNILEITLRTPDALDCIRAIAAEVKDAIVGAGTVINGDLLNQAVDAGSRFIVSPGLTEDVARAAAARTVPLLAGVANASDIMRGLALGLSTFKFFPAETSGGAPAIKALGGPFPQVRFCPTGGVSPKNLGDYLGLPNVICAGGSWMVPSDLSAPGAFDRVTEMAREAHALAQGLVRA
ncbi:MAG: bifunctional 4-hydroxy-2-oxoglutarate aldolase/2-dehydro-3-deoxy-phosphogluconate aldolase [Alphaproteobacteria bacterium]|nr:bifunctional 4-hydroxy-2-oxoglutarate aldolase/2-dehydro-3-deoxy-phosphogluconate aldolase [Alphaproteobacteria bacterium]